MAGIWLSHKATHQRPKAGHSGWWVQLQGQVSEAGVAWVSVGTWRPGHSSRAPRVFRVPLGLPGCSERWDSPTAPLSKGARGPQSPDDEFVCLGDPARRAYHIFLGTWEGGLCSCDTKWRPRGVYTKLPNWPLSSCVCGSYSFFSFPDILFLSPCPSFVSF